MKASGALKILTALFALAGFSPALAQSAQKRAPAAASIPLTPPLDEAAGRKRVLDELFERLVKAQDAEEGEGIAGAIERVWLRSNSDTADLLMSRARAMLQAKDAAVALEILDRLVALEPEWAEAWRMRANARFLDGNKGGAVEDLGRTLALEPRHFAALMDLGSVLHEAGFNKRALEVLRRALDVHPRQPDVRTLVDQLAPDVDGRDI